MATGVDSEVEGLTTFALNPVTRFRYVISVKSERINIWLEDLCSKKQWRSGFTSKNAYVTAANVFVDASAADYAACFQQCLNCPLDETEDSQRKLTPSVIDGQLQLEMSIKLRLLQSARQVNYVFTLGPVEVKQIDVLESKLKDLQEEMQQLRGQVGTTEHTSLYAESVTWSPSKLQWKIMRGQKFLLTANNTAIKVLTPELYAVSVLVNHHSTEDEGSISLEKNEVVVQRAAIGRGNCLGSKSKYGDKHVISHVTSTSLMCSIPIKKNEAITVSFSGTAAVANTVSYLTAVRIGA